MHIAKWASLNKVRSTGPTPQIRFIFSQLMVRFPFQLIMSPCQHPDLMKASFCAYETDRWAGYCHKSDLRPKGVDCLAQSRWSSLPAFRKEFGRCRSHTMQLRFHAHPKKSNQHIYPQVSVLDPARVMDPDQSHTHSFRPRPALALIDVLVSCGLFARFTWIQISSGRFSQIWFKQVEKGECIFQHMASSKQLRDGLSWEISILERTVYWASLEPIAIAGGSYIAALTKVSS